MILKFREGDRLVKYDCRLVDRPERLRPGQELFMWRGEPDCWVKVKVLNRMEQAVRVEALSEDFEGIIWVEPFEFIRASCYHIWHKTVQ